MTKLNLAAARSIMTATTTFKQFAIAAEARWPVQTDHEEYKPLLDAFTAARKAAIQDGPKTINEPTAKPAKAAKATNKKEAAKAAKGKAKVSFKPAKAEAKGKAEPKAAKAAEVTLTSEEQEAIEAIVRSKTVRPCGCGCGAETRSSFLPGHDAKLRSRLITEAKARKAK